MSDSPASILSSMDFSPKEQVVLARIEDLLAVRMKDARKRHLHSLGVARTAYRLAQTYDVSTFNAVAAGLLHDWDKVVPHDELVMRAIRYGIDVSGSLSMVAPLLHGPVAARELPELFPELHAAVFQAIERHTVAARDMTPLDMVVFVADTIEPGRRGDYADNLRAMVGTETLLDLFFACFAQGLVYVIEGSRYLYPTALDIYNHYVLQRAEA